MTCGSVFGITDSNSISKRISGGIKDKKGKSPCKSFAMDAIHRLNVYILWNGHKCQIIDSAPNERNERDAENESE